MIANQRHVITRSAIFIVNKLWLLVATAIIVTAVVFTLLRLFLPQINYFKSDIENWIESTYKVDVEIEDIQAEWGVKGPVFSLQNFKLNASDGQLSLMQVESLSIQFDGIATLFSGNVITDEISITGANFNFILDRKLAVRFDTLQEETDSLQLPEVQETSRVLLTYLFNQKRLVVLDSKMTIETLSGRDFNYHLSQLEISNYDEIHQISGRLIDDHLGQLKLVAEIFGDPAEDQSYTNFYLEGKDVLLSELPGYEKHPKLKPLSGKLNWRLWSDWRAGRWETAIGDIQLSDLAWSSQDNTSATNKPALNIDLFNLDFKWRFNDEKSGMLTFFNGTLEKENQSSMAMPEVFMLFDQPKEGDIRWQLMTHKFNFAPLAESFLNPVLSLTTEDSQLEIENFILDLDSFAVRAFRENNIWRKPTVFSRISELSYSKIADLPTINNVSGELKIINGASSAELFAKDTELDFKGLFRNKLKFSDMAILFNWGFDENGNFQFSTENAYFTNSHLTLRAKAHYFKQDDEPVLSLFAQLSDINATHKSLYLPSGIMSEGLTEYLDSSVISGYLPLVKAVVHGPLDSFPFDNNEGLFSILGVLENSTYRYLPEWPIAEEFSAKLLFEGNGMDLQALGGKAQGVEVNSARAVIRDYSAPNTPFELYLDAKSQGNSGKAFLANTPLKYIAESIAVLDYEGEIGTRIDLFLGLEDSSNLKARGEITPELKGSKLTIANFQVSNIEGYLSIDEKGVKPSEFKALYHGNPVTANLSGAEDEAGPELTIRAQGKLNSSAVSDIVGEGWSQLINGESDVIADILVAPISDRDSTLIKVTSDLDGVSVNLPGELSKTRDTVEPLAVEVKIGKTSHAHIEWQKFQGKWWWKSEDPEQQLGGQFLYNSERQLSSSDSSDYFADIVLEEFNIEDWQSVISLANQEKSSTPLSSHPDINLNFKINNLLTPISDLQQVSINATKKAEQNWLFASESSAGKLSLQIRENQPWKLEVESLALELKETLFNEQDKSELGSAKNEGDHNSSEVAGHWDSPENWPEISFFCGDCKVDKVHLGKVNAEILHNQKGIEFKGNINNGKRHNLDFNLIWSHEEARDTQLTTEKSQGSSDLQIEALEDKSLTQLDFSLTSNDLGKLLTQFDYPSAVKDSGANISGKLWWPNKPWSYDVLEVEGLANFRLGQGYISEVSDARARLFSLFSLQSLSRRLQLDFSDVFKKGFHYEKLNGDIGLQQGVLSAHRLYVDGSAAKVTLNGQLDLKDNTMEQHALVVPQLTSSLPVLVGWAVEPTTGVIVYLLNKIFEPAIEVVTQIEYRIHGSLDDIKLDEIKRSKSKVKYEESEDEESEGKEKVNKESDGNQSEEAEPNIEIGNAKKSLSSGEKNAPNNTLLLNQEKQTQSDEYTEQKNTQDDNKIPF